MADETQAEKPTAEQMERLREALKVAENKQRLHAEAVREGRMPEGLARATTELVDALTDLQQEVRALVRSILTWDLGRRSIVPGPAAEQQRAELDEALVEIAEASQRHHLLDLLAHLEQAEDRLTDEQRRACREAKASVVDARDRPEGRGVGLTMSEPSETSRDRSPAEPGPPTLPPKRVRVYCSQFAECRWSGIRVSDRLGVQPKPCPRCGKEVVR